MDKRRIEFIEEVLAEATAWPWHEVIEIKSGQSTYYVNQFVTDERIATAERREDAVLIAMAPGFIADLLAEVKHLRKLNKKHKVKG